MKKNSSSVNETVETLVGKMLIRLGEEPSREGLKETPRRVSKMYSEILGGYQEDEKKLFKTFRNNGYEGLISITNIDFYSLCEHHMVPFFGKVHIGYMPNGRVLGLSKFARIVEMYSKRLQTQENLTQQIANSLETNLHPRGLIVHVEAEHLCVSMRGIKKKGFITKTTYLKGLLENDSKLTDQFYRDIKTYDSH